MVHLCSDRFAWRITDQKGRFVYYVVQKYLENLCDFMQINLDVNNVDWMQNHDVQY